MLDVVEYDVSEAIDGTDEVLRYPSVGAVQVEGPANGKLKSTIVIRRSVLENKVPDGNLNRLLEVE
jgi:hypothetical protein